MFPRVSRAIFFTAALSAASTLGREALASDAQEQRLAQALFDEARRLMDAKRYAEACPKLVESQRLDPGGGTLLNLGICHEKEGHLATAKNDFEEALAVAIKDGRKDRQKIANERIAAVDAAIPRVTVVVAAAADLDGLEVKLDGFVLRRAAWGVATPVEPGSHCVEVNAMGRAPWSTTIQVGAGQRKHIDVPPLGPLTQLPTGPQAPSSVIVADATVPVDIIGTAVERPSPDAVPTSADRASPVFYTVLATTLVLTTTSAVTGIMALSASQDAKVGCLPDRKYCRDQGSADAADRAATLGWVSTVTLGLAAAGVVALLAIPSRTVVRHAPVRGSAGLLPGGAALGLSGNF